MLWLLLACGKDLDTTQVRSLRVEPSEFSLEVRQGEPATATFTAVARFSDGREGPLDLVTWSLSNLSVGEVSPGGVLTTVDSNGGITEVVATHLGLEASAAVTVVYSEDLVEDGVDPGLVDAFAAASPEQSSEVAVVYPEDGVGVPRNVDGLTFFWDHPEGSDAAQVRLQSAITDIRVYTTGSAWTPSADLWARAAAANSQGAVEVTVTVGAWDGATLSGVQSSEPIALTVHRLDARGSVLYWQSGNESIMRIPFGSTEAEAFWTAEDSRGRCTGCHVVSDEGAVMVVSHDGIDGRFTVVDISDPDEPRVMVEPVDDHRTSFKTISPDGRYVFSTNSGVADLYATADGSLLRTYTFDDYAAQPDWSPDGEHIALVLVRSGLVNDFDFTGGEIVEVSFDAQSLDLGEPVVLVPADDTYNHYYPAWSPDGEWLAYNRTVGSGYASEGAELFLLHRASGQVLALDAANAGGVKNSYPRWGPLPDDDVLWLAFSSERPYPEQDFLLPQIQVSAIDLAKAAAGEDPSSAPFWLPGQDLRSDNHLPFWWSE